jgi:integrase
MSMDEVRSILSRMNGQHLLMAELLYGGGLRLLECVRLRVNSIDMSRGLIYVRFGKGGKDRSVPLPAALADRIGARIENVSRIHESDVADGFGEAWLPEGFAKKLGPGGRDLGWQYLFPAKKRSVDPRSGKTMRHHVLDLGGAKGRSGRCSPDGADQTDHLSYVSSQLRHAPV